MKNTTNSLSTIDNTVLDHVSGGVEWGEAWNQANSWAEQTRNRTGSPIAAAASWGAGFTNGVWNSWGK